MEHTAVLKKNSKIYIQNMKTWNQYLHIAFFSLSIVWCGIIKIFEANFYLKIFDLVCKTRGRKGENITKTQKLSEPYEKNIAGTLP